MTKIGVIGPLSPDSFADNVLSTLSSMGVEAVSLGSASRRPKSRLTAAALEMARQVPSIDSRLQSKILRKARLERLDIVLALESSLLPSIVRDLKMTGAAVALWFPDAMANLSRQLMLLGDYDAIFFKEPRLVAAATELLDLPVTYLPEACNPLWHQPPPGDERSRTVLLAGNMYAFRVRLLERLQRAGLPLQLYGPPWPRSLRSSSVAACHQGRYIARHEKAALFRSAAVVLNTLHPTEIDGVNCRLFEAAGCGATVLTEWRPEAARFFDIGTEIAAFKTFDELVDQARRLIVDSVGSRAMGDRATIRAHRDHTYRQRLQVALASLGWPVS